MMAAIRKIGTHDGVFHCDEVLACFMLKKLPEYANAEIVRTRQQNLLDACDIVVDVGAEYDPSKHRYDHHQRSFNSTMNSLVPSRPWKVKLSSAGLVYHHFGERILEAIVGPNQDSGFIPTLFNYVYNNFIEEIDGLDNGVPMFDGEPKYRIHTNLSSRIGDLNPSWNNTEPFDELNTFCKAMEIAGGELKDKIDYFAKCWWPARKIVADAVTNRFKVHESGEILEIKPSCPWKDHLSLIEKDDELGDTIKFVIFTDTKGNWRVQGVPVEPTSFMCRVFLNNKWQGLRDNELCEVSGIENCMFVHANGFIGGNTTREGALAMAIKSIQLYKEQGLSSNGVAKQISM